MAGPGEDAPSRASSSKFSAASSDVSRMASWVDPAVVIREMDLSEALQRQGGDKANVAPTRAALTGSGEDAPSRASSWKSAFFSEALHGCVAEMLSPLPRDGSSTLPAGIDEDFRTDVQKHGLPAPRSHYYSELKFVDEARTSIHGDVPDRANHLPEGALWMPEMLGASDLRLSSVSTQESVSDCSIEVPLGVHVWCPETMSTTPPDTSPCKAPSAATSTVMPQLDLSRTVARADPAPGHRKVSHAHMSPRPMTQRAAKEPEGVRPGRSQISEIGVSVDRSTLKDQSADTAGHVAALPAVNPANNGDMAPLAAGHMTSGDACQNDGDDSPEASNGALEASPVLPAKHAWDSTRERVSLCAQRVVPAHCVLPARRKLDVSSPLVLTADDDAAVEALVARGACPQDKPSSPSSFAHNHGDAGDLLSALSSLGGETVAAGRDGPPASTTVTTVGAPAADQRAHCRKPAAAAAAAPTACRTISVAATAHPAPGRASPIIRVLVAAVCLCVCVVMLSGCRPVASDQSARGLFSSFETCLRRGHRAAGIAVRALHKNLDAGSGANAPSLAAPRTEYTCVHCAVRKRRSSVIDRHIF